MNKLFVCTNGSVFVGTCGTFRFAKNESRFNNPSWDKFRKEYCVNQFQVSYTFVERGRDTDCVLSACGLTTDEVPLYN